jgi:UDP-N-acetylmuramoyl-L-alanyl-D-glutamate--2,6-diaminopimelate ligase
MAAGASAIVAQTPPPGGCDVAWIHVPDARAALARLAAQFHAHPSDRLLVAAVTGTNGKTTTACLTHHLLNAAHLRCGLIGTIAWDTGAGETIPATHTTPESLELQELLSKMCDNGCRAVAMEASSHALHQHRVDAVKFDAAIFTNLTQDHLDYHGTIEKYFEAKARLFEITAARPEGKLIINLDDKFGRRLIDQYQNHPGMRTYGFGVNAHYRAADARCELNGTTYELIHRGRSLLARTPLTGMFNVHNSLAAVATAHALGCNFRESVTNLKNAPQIPGRMQRISDRDRFHVFVDYAHTPDGLINAIAAARALRPTRVVTVFGCGGDRDRMKRPLMARAVEEGSDICILTSDNPRSESPAQIMEDARKGFTKQTHVLIEDRKEAIRKAIMNARAGDLVLIAGKGHENYQEIKGIRHPFDDAKIAHGYLNMRREEFS